jgi:hypothetical protein
MCNYLTFFNNYRVDHSYNRNLASEKNAIKKGVSFYEYPSSLMMACQTKFNQALLSL